MQEKSMKFFKYKGNNYCAILKAHEDDWFDFEEAVGETCVNICGVNLSRYDIYENAGKKFKNDFSGLFSFCLEHKIKSIDSPLVKGETLEEKIKFLKQNDWDEEEKYNLMKCMEFEDMDFRPFSAYIHSGICLSLNGFNDPWDSGCAGFAWIEYDDPWWGGYYTKEGKQTIFEETFQLYDDYVRGLFIEYSYHLYKENNGEWEESDSYTLFEKSVEEAWKDCLYKDAEIVDKPFESLFSWTAKKHEITLEDCVKELLSL